MLQYTVNISIVTAGSISIVDISSRQMHALHATRSSHEKFVCLSDCSSDKRVDCDKTTESSVQIFTPYERSFILVFWEYEWLVEGNPFYIHKMFCQTDPVEANRRFSIDIRS